MLFVLIFFILISVILLILLIQSDSEMRHLNKQLFQIEQGSQMELTSYSRRKDVLKMYRRLNRILSGFYADGRKYMRSQNQLKQTISSIAHDIRTPLTSAAGYLQMLEECEDPLKQTRYKEIIQKRLEELKEMLEELFLYTKLTNDDFILECRSTAVFPVLCEAVAGMYHLFEESKREPAIQFESESICVSASDEALGRIFRNLINNALLHGIGTLKITQKGNVVTFSNQVENGSVIDAGQLFERFYKADSARQKGSSGLGLAIVKELMNRMGGQTKAVVQDNILSISLQFQEPSQ